MNAGRQIEAQHPIIRDIRRPVTSFIKRFFAWGLVQQQILGTPQEERVFHGLTLAAFILAVAVFLIAPFQALSWSAKPFPGFVVEQTLVASETNGVVWGGRQVGLNYPQRIVRIDSQAINTLGDFNAAVELLKLGQRIRVTTVTPGGVAYTFDAIKVGRFPAADLLRLFWLPYGIGIVFLFLGWSVYRLRGFTRAGRAFANFCAFAAISSGLIFDLATTHNGSALWTFALAQQGGTLISLGLLFPEEWNLIRQRPSLRIVPYGASMLLAVWGLWVLYDRSDPWAYVTAWRFSYIFAALGIVIFLALMLYRQGISTSNLARLQARTILLGSSIAFTPLAIWLGAPLFNIHLSWNPALYLPMLLFFPLSIGVAILRYRMWDIQVIINRTLVYGALTLLLATVYFGVILVVEFMLSSFIPRTSQIAATLSTLVIAALFNPLRSRTQVFIDRRFYREKYDATKAVLSLSAALRDEVNLAHLTEKVENVIWETVHPAHVLTWLRSPQGFSVYLDHDDSSDEEYEREGIALDDPLTGFLNEDSGVIELDWLDLDSPGLQELKYSRVKLLIPLISQRELIGWFTLGPRLGENEYSATDRILLANLAAQAAPAMRVAQLASQERSEALEMDRMQHEMQVARLIQQTLLPKEMPYLPGWQAAAHYQPARAVGGDFYDFIERPNGELVIFVGDVSDKGVPAALVMASTRAVLRGAAHDLGSPGAVLQRANELLCPEMPVGMFATCICVFLDPVSGNLCFANAGHNLPYRRSRAGVEELRAVGMPLGLMPESKYEEHEARILPGECLLFYSDGLVEAHNPSDEMFGEERLESAIGEQQQADMIQCLLGELSRFTGSGWVQEDDVTLVALRRLEENVEG